METITVSPAKAGAQSNGTSLALGPRFRAGLSGEISRSTGRESLRRALHFTVVMPGLVLPCAGHPRLASVAGKAWMAGSRRYDDKSESANVGLQPHFFPRTALRFRGENENDDSICSKRAAIFSVISVSPWSVFSTCAAAHAIALPLEGRDV
ncbi:MAG: hypothetical protein ACLQJR_16205 [Stellaceae bacterium]